MNPEFSMTGVQDQLDVFEDRLSITPKGVLGFLNKGMKGKKEIPFRSITAIQIKEAGSIFSGYIQFTIPGGNESRGGLFSAVSDENTFVFSGAKNNEEANAIKRYIDFQIDNIHSHKNSSPSPSLSDEIIKLADLHSKGILSDEEFRTAKASLLK